MEIAGPAAAAVQGQRSGQLLQAPPKQAVPSPAWPKEMATALQAAHVTVPAAKPTLKLFFRQSTPAARGGRSFPGSVPALSM